MTTRLCLTPADHGRPITLDEFDDSDFREGSRYEVIEGRLEVSPAPELPHEDFSEWLVTSLRDYARLRPDIINKVKAPARIFLPASDEVSAPEADFGAYAGYPVGTPPSRRRWRDVSPLLVGEMISLDTAEKDLVRNRRLYLAVASIREYWMIDPRDDADRPSLLILRRRSPRRWAAPIRVAPGQTYTTPMLPGFALLVEPTD